MRKKKNTYRRVFEVCSLFSSSL